MSENERSDELELDLARFWHILRVNRRYVALGFLGVLAIVLLASFTTSPRYRAQALVLIRRVELPLQVLGLPQEISALLPTAQTGLSNYLEIAKSPQTLEALRERLALDPQYAKYAQASSGHNPSGALPSHLELKDRLTVRAVTNANILRIEATGRYPEEAALLANHAMEAFRTVERQMSLRSLKAVISFLDRQIEEARAQLGLTTEELVKLAQQFGLAVETAAYTAKLSRLEQLLAEAKVELEDLKFQLETVNSLLAQLKEEILYRFGGPEGAALLTELIDKLALIRQIQRQIIAWEEERSRYLAEGNYIKAKELEEKIKRERKKLEETAAAQYKMLESLPRYEELITRQFDLELKIVALENRIKVLEEQRAKELNALLGHGMELTRAKREVDVGEQLYILLITQYAKARLAEAAELGAVEPLAYAQPPFSPEWPNRKLNLGVGAVLGLFCGVGLAFARHALRRTFQSDQEVEEMCAAPVLATIPYIRKGLEGLVNNREKNPVLPALEKGSPEYEAFVSLSSALKYVFPDQPPKAVLVTSADPRVGKTLIAVNLAWARALGRQKVLLIETDYRRPALGEMLGLSVEEEPGLAEVVMGEASLEKAVHRVESPGFEALEVLLHGERPPNIVDFFDSQRFAQALANFRAQYDVVILDGPPLLVAVDAAVLATLVEATLLVVDIEETPRQEVRTALRLLEQYRAKVHGVVLNKVRRASAGYAYYYRYHGEGKRKTFKEKMVAMAQKTWPFSESRKNRQKSPRKENPQSTKR